MQARGNTKSKIVKEVQMYQQLHKCELFKLGS